MELTFKFSGTRYEESLVSGRNLGDTAFANGMWAEAIQDFAYAIEAFESSPSWITSQVRQHPIRFS